MAKKGKCYKFYLSPEDAAIYEKALEEDHFTQRGPHLMQLIQIRSEIKAFQYDRAKEAISLIKRFKIPQNLLDMANKDV